MDFDRRKYRKRKKNIEMSNYTTIVIRPGWGLDAKYDKS